MESFTESSWLVASGQTRTPTDIAIRFEIVPVKNETKSDAEGKPVFEDHEYIEKRVPGDKLNIIFRRITEQDKKDFPQQYKQWKSGLEDPESGMPLKQWAPMTRSEVETFAYHGVRTVEDLAGMSDAKCKGIGAGVMKRRDMALDWLKQANGNAPAIHLRSELEKRDRQIDALQRQLSELARLSGKSSPAQEIAAIPYVGAEPVAPIAAPAIKPKRTRKAAASNA